VHHCAAQQQRRLSQGGGVRMQCVTGQAWTSLNVTLVGIKLGRVLSGQGGSQMSIQHSQFYLLSAFLQVLMLLLLAMFLPECCHGTACAQAIHRGSVMFKE
jgi:hypothetical protein